MRRPPRAVLENRKATPVAFLRSLEKYLAFPPKSSRPFVITNVRAD